MMKMKKVILTKNKAMSDYQKAKNIVETLEILEEVVLEVSSIVNCRKYLRDMQRPKKFITNEIDGKLKVTRIK